jgi:hypothetical protein
VSSPLDRTLSDAQADRMRMAAVQMLLHPQQSIRELSYYVVAFSEDRAARQEIAVAIRKREREAA